MKMIVVSEEEYKRAFDECLLKIGKAFRESPSSCASGDDSFRTVNYYVHELKERLEKG